MEDVSFWTASAVNLIACKPRTGSGLSWRDLATVAFLLSFLAYTSLVLLL